MSEEDITPQDPAPSDPAPSDPAPSDPAPTDPPQEPAVAERPEYVPEKFWDPEAGAIKSEDLLKSYSHLEKKLSGKNMAPEEYAVNIPEGIELEIEADDPMLQAMTGIFKESGLTQEQFDKVFGTYVEQQVALEQAIVDQKKAEFAQLGSNASQRLSGIASWIDSNFPDNQAEWLKGKVDAVVGVEAIERLMEMGKPPSLDPKDKEIDTSEHEKLREEFLAVDDNGRRKMKDPEYARNWRSRAAKAGFTG